MRTSGVICECNPFHAGHGYLFDCARAEADALVCVMSDWFTQRGEAAVLDPSVRAEILLRHGADAVFALPFPFSSAPGEQFGAAGVSLLSGLGVDDLWFGSECGDLAKLRAAAELSDRPEFLASYRAAVRSGAGTAAAYADGLRAEMGGDAPLSPNDLLAVSYLRALKRTGSAAVPHTVRRAGSGYHDAAVQADSYPSATALRALLFRGGAQALARFCDAPDLTRILAEEAAGRAPADIARLDAVFLSWLRTAEAGQTDGVPGFGGGIGRRLAQAAWEAPDLAGALRCAGVRCPDSRLRRGMLLALAGVTEEDLRAAPACAVLLAANGAGCRFLASLRHCSPLPVVSKRAAFPASPRASRQLLLNDRAAALWSLCLPVPVSPQALLRRGARIEA